MPRGVPRESLLPPRAQPAWVCCPHLIVRGHVEKQLIPLDPKRKRGGRGSKGHLLALGDVDVQEGLPGVRVLLDCEEGLLHGADWTLGRKGRCRQPPAPRPGPCPRPAQPPARALPSPLPCPVPSPPHLYPGPGPQPQTAAGAAGPRSPSGRWRRAARGGSEPVWCPGLVEPPGCCLVHSPPG